MMRRHWICWHDTRLILSLALATAISAVSGSRAGAQPPNPGSGWPNPRLFTVVPCGGQIGKTVEVTFTGTDLEEPESLVFSNPGIKAEPIVPPPPAPDPKNPKAQPPKQPVTKFKVTIAPNTPLGVHDIRLVNKWGVSNPRAFVAGDLPEVLEKEPNNDVEQAHRVELNSTIHGNMANPTDVDYFVFAGKAGQRVVVGCLASTIDSRAQPGLELYDKAGRQLAFNRMYEGTDALLDHTLPADGDYFVRVYEYTYTRGNPEHFYRLTISTAPWIDAVVPPLIELGKPNQLIVYGRNLPGGIPDRASQVDGRPLERLLVTVNVPADPSSAAKLNFSGALAPPTASLDGTELRLRNATGSSNPYLLTHTRSPASFDNRDNDTAERSQEVPVPCEIVGLIEKKNDRDWYSFQCKKGDVWNIELLADRIGTPADLYMVLRNPATKQDLADLDDNPDTLHPFKFFTRSSDPPRHRFVAPADGKYQLMVTSRDANVNASPRHLYVIRLMREQPDFRLYVLPSDDFRPDSCQLAKNGEQFFHVMAWRFDGFNGPITVTAEGLPPGVTCSPAIIAPNMRQVPLVLSAAPDAKPGINEIKIKGTAAINGQTVAQEARPAHIVWPGQPGLNLPLLSRMARNTVMAVREPSPYRVAAALDKVNVLQGEKANLKLTVARHSPEFKTPLQALAIDLPPNLLTVNNNQPMTIAPDKKEATAAVDAKVNLPPGTYTIVLRTTAQMPYAKDPMAKQKPNINLVQPSNAVSITVWPKQVATLTVPNPNVTAKAGAQAEVPIKLARMNNYAGEFKVQVVAPPEVKGLTADEVTVSAGKDEAKLVLRFAPEMAAGALANIVIRATAMQGGNLPTVHEAKLNVTVAK